MWFPPPRILVLHDVQISSGLPPELLEGEGLEHGVRDGVGEDKVLVWVSRLGRGGLADRCEEPEETREAGYAREEFMGEPGSRLDIQYCGSGKTFVVDPQGPRDCGWCNGRRLLPSRSWTAGLPLQTERGNAEEEGEVEVHRVEMMD